MTAPKIVQFDPRTYPPRGYWAPGDYMCRCTDCSTFFWGAKRALTCATCAYKPEFAVERASKLRAEIPRLVQPSQADFDMVTLLTEVENLRSVIVTLKETLRSQQPRTEHEIEGLTSWLTRELSLDSTRTVKIQTGDGSDGCAAKFYFSYADLSSLCVRLNKDGTWTSSVGQ